MVDVGEKPVTTREALARAELRMRPETLALILTNEDSELKESWHVSPVEVAMYLDVEWVVCYGEDHPPATAVLLSRKPLPGRKVRARFTWRREREQLGEQTWFVLEPT